MDSNGIGSNLVNLARSGAATSGLAPNLKIAAALAREVGLAVGVIGAFVAIGVGWVALGRVLRPVGNQPAPYSPPSVATPDDPPPVLWIVDGFNLLHVALLRGESRDGWWRQAGRERVVDLAQGFDAAGAEVVIVFDGALGPGEQPERSGRPRVVFAAPADDWVLDRVRSAGDPGRVAVVTADRRLAARARHRGARVVSPSAFAARCRATPADQREGTS